MRQEFNTLGEISKWINSNIEDIEVRETLMALAVTNKNSKYIIKIPTLKCEGYTTQVIINTLEDMDPNKILELITWNGNSRIEKAVFHLINMRHLQREEQHMQR